MEKCGVEAKFDNMRVYACRCPSCKRFMNVPGTTLNNEKYIKCWNCGAKGRTEKWIGGSYVKSKI